MGVELGDLAVKRPINLSDLSGKTVAIDAFNALYQFLASIRQEDGTPLMDFKGNITAHLSGLFYRTARLMENGIRPIYVFDGAPPAFKKETIRHRSEIKRIAEEKWKKAMEEERLEDARKYAQAASRLTQPMIEECKELLTAMGLPHVQAPSEGEAEAAVMAKQNLVHASSSQDYDSLLFGSPRIIRNITISGKRKVSGKDKFILVQPEEIILKDTLDSIGVSREQLVWMGLLTGSDFNEGVMKVGPKTALKIVKEHRTFPAIKAYVKEKYNYEFEPYIDEVAEFFLNPPYEKPADLRQKPPSLDAISKILCERHDFSEERVSRVVEQTEKAVNELNTQSKLKEWF